MKTEETRTMRASHLSILTLVVLLALPGAARAKGDGLEFEAELSGAQEVPGADTDAQESAKVEFEEDLSAVNVRLKVRDTEGEVTGAHFHCNRAGVNGPIAFGLFSPGPCDFDGQRTECTLTNEDLTDLANDCEDAVGQPVNNIAALAFAMRAGLIYINVHSTAFSAGETRGQLLPRD